MHKLNTAFVPTIFVYHTEQKSITVLLLMGPPQAACTDRLLHVCVLLWIRRGAGYIKGYTSYRSNRVTQ